MRGSAQFQYFRKGIGRKPKNTMSNATCAWPIASSQLFFAWSEQNETLQPSSSSPSPTRVASAATQHDAISAQRGAGQSACLSFTREARIAKPVRMGAVMIKLLKRYGITDQEIAEGVANYARKHQKALAS